MKRTISVLLVALILAGVFSSLPMTAFAGEETSQGKSGASDVISRGVEETTCPETTDPGNQPEPTEWYVIGDEELCGIDWQIDLSNEMEQNGDGVFVKQFSMVPKGVYQFEITDETGKWKYTGYGKHYMFNVTAAATEVTIFLNRRNGEVTVSGEGVISYVTVAGNSNGSSFLYGHDWDPEAQVNRMSTEDGKIYTKNFEAVPKKEGFQFKFAANGNWEYSWGDDKYEPDGHTAAWLGDSINLSFDYDYANVKLTLDLTDFDYETKLGAVYTVEIEECDAPEVEFTTAPEPQPKPTEWYIIGDEEICGIDWQIDLTNEMEQNSDGIFVKQFSMVPKGVYQFEITDKTGKWKYNQDGKHYIFDVTATATEVTIFLNGRNGEVTVSGEGVISYVTVAGSSNGSTFLYGNEWKPKAYINRMFTEDGKIYTKNFEAVPKKEGFQFKFAANGSWDYSWGDDKYEPDGHTAAWLGDSINLSFDYDYANVKLTLDLTDFDYETRSGAVYTVEIEECDAPEVEATFPTYDETGIAPTDASELPTNPGTTPTTDASEPPTNPGTTPTTDASEPPTNPGTTPTTDASEPPTNPGTSATTVVSSGTTGQCTWTLDDEGTLTISGNGNMGDYNNICGPWGTSIKNVIIEDGVKRIGSDAFRDCSVLASIEIPDSVTRIGNDAFFNCENLTSVNVEDIGAWCNINFPEYSSNPLYYAHNLYLNGELVTDLVIPNSVTSINAYAFYYCYSITSVSIPDSTSSIYNKAFCGCRNLTSLDISNPVPTIKEQALEGTGWYDNQPDGYVYINKVLYRYKMDFPYFEGLDIVIKDGTKAIADGAFSYPGYEDPCCNSITIPGSVKYIGGVFEDCRFNSIYITDLAAWCSFNLSFYYPNNPWLVSTIYLNGERINNEIIIPDTVTKIGYSTFCGDNIKKVYIPDSVTYIDNYAFFSSSLKSVTIPDSVTHIGDYAFGYYFSMDETYPKVDGFTIYGIPGSAAEDYANANGFNFVEIIYNYSIMADGTAEITGYNGDSRTVSIPSEIDGYTVTSIGDSAFKECDLISVTIPNTVTKIGKSAFKSCAALSSVNIPDSVVSIGESAFYQCDSLNSATLSNSIAYIGTEGLPNNENLVVYTPHETITKIKGFSSYSSYNSVKFCGTDAHTYDAEHVVFTWADNKGSATAAYSCISETGCIFEDTSDAVITNAVENGKIKRTASVELEGTTYSDTITIDSPLDAAFETAITAGAVVATDGNLFRLPSDLEYKKASVLGVQKKEKIKTDENNSTGLRFIAELSSEYVGKDNVDYGFEVVKTKKQNTAAFNDNNGFNTMQSLIDSGSANIKSYSCKDTTNTVANAEYGDGDPTSTAYKYATLAIKNVDNAQGIAVRFYVEVDGVRNYASYTNSNGTYIGCCTSYDNLVNIEAANS